MTLRTLLAALLSFGVLCAALPASAQQPVNPTASSVKEEDLLKALKPGVAPVVAGRGSIPDEKSRNLIQPAGREWREFHQSTLPRLGALAILGMLAVTVLFYLVRGKVRISGGRSGTTITRFGGFERFTHWLTATSFIVLGLTGLNITFGKSVLLPIVGPETFTAISQTGKFVHNYVSFAFALGVVLTFLIWVKDNFPHPRDLLWFLKGGGLIGSWHPAAGRFNGGQKIIFWSVVLGGGALAVTGYILMFPFAFTDIGGQQFANIIHGLVGVVLVAIIIGHIYIGSVGMEGAFDAMGSGKVDVNWARDHHSIWVDQMGGADAKGAKPTPAE